MTAHRQTGVGDFRLSCGSTVLLAMAAFALGQALQVNNGFFHGRAVQWLSVALGAMGGACIVARRGVPLASATMLRLVLLAGIVFQLAQLLSDPPLLYARLRHGRDDMVLALALLTTAVLASAIAFGGTAIRRIGFAGVLAAHLVVGVRTIQLVPEPTIDVVTVHEAAFDALADGRSPYGITFKNIYGSSTRFYGEGMASDTEVRFGFPYPPLALALSAPGHWLLGDYRYSLVAALLAVGVLLASFGWTRHAMLSATLLLTTPRVLFEIEQGWTEPLVLLMLVTLVVVLHRRPASAGVVAGFGMAVKQYLGLVLLLLPPASTDAPRSWRRHPIVVSLAVATVITVPFVIWDFRGFMNSVVWLQLREPFRLDSLSFLVSMAHRGLHPPTTVMTLTAVAVATIVVRRTLPRNAAGFAAAMAIVSVAAFAFGKKAFCNYYFFVIGALVTAVAATGHGESTEEAELGRIAARKG